MSCSIVAGKALTGRDARASMNPRCVGQPSGMDLSSASSDRNFDHSRDLVWDDEPPSLAAQSLWLRFGWRASFQLLVVEVRGVVVLAADPFEALVTTQPGHFHRASNCIRSQEKV